MNSNYNIPVISPNLSRPETLIQIHDVLIHLTNISNDIFDRINKRVADNSKILAHISSRVDIVTAKINKLKGAKKTIQVFSSSKYPASDVNRQYKSIFDGVETIKLTRSQITIDNHKDVENNHDASDKLQIYHVKVSKKPKEKRVGLGDVPNDLRCVNDVLLYNSGKNIYKDFEICDNLKGPQAIVEDDTIDGSALGPAPFSISQRSTMRKSTAHSYFYTPKIGELPEIDVPLDLPDLPGIADDLRYETTTIDAIAPSAAATPIINDLPALNIDDKKEEEEKVNLPELPLPPPLPPAALKEAKLPKQEPEVKIELPSPPAPPPPPPPPPVPPPAPPETNKDVVASPVNLPPVNDARANLMEAIRKAGGSKNAKLKATKPKEATKKSQPPSGDLMADLHSKLLMRRKGISGAKKNEENTSGPSIDANTTMGRISALIPPPAA